MGNQAPPSEFVYHLQDFPPVAHPRFPDPWVGISFMQVVGFQDTSDLAEKIKESAMKQLRKKYLLAMQFLAEKRTRRFLRNQQVVPGGAPEIQALLIPVAGHMLNLIAQGGIYGMADGPYAIIF